MRARPRGASGPPSPDAPSRPARARELDVRPMLARGEEPYRHIIAAAGALADDEALVLRSPFDPLPVHRVLAGLGFAHEVRRRGPDDWESVYRRRPARAGAQGHCPVPGRRTLERQATVGGPPWQIPAALLSAAALAQAAGAVALFAAAPDLAAGVVYGPAQLGGAHLLGLAFLTVAIFGALLHLMPMLFRRRLASPLRAAIAGAALAVGSWALAGGLWSGRAAVIAVGGTLVIGGGAILLGDLTIALVGVARQGPLGATGVGLAAAGAWFAIVLALGGVMAANRVEPFLHVDRLRLIAAHAAVALVGWVGGTILAMALRLAPMLALARGHDHRPGAAALLAWHASVPPIAIGLGLGIAPLAAAGALLLLGACALAGWSTADVARRRGRPPEAPLVHLALGIASVAAACCLMLAAWAGAGDPYRLAIPATLLVLLGAGAGITSGHLFKLVPMLVWSGRHARRAEEPGTPRLADLYPGTLALVEQVAFTAGLALLATGAGVGSEGLARAGAAALALAAAAVVAAVGVCVLGRPQASRRSAPVPDATGGAT